VAAAAEAVAATARRETKPRPTASPEPIANKARPSRRPGFLLRPATCFPPDTYARCNSITAISGTDPNRTGNIAIPKPREMYTGHVGPCTSPRTYFCP
jgi:hypothetical protein